MSWTIDDARALYSVDRWAEGLFDVAADGRVVALPCGAAGPRVPLDAVVAASERQGLALPLLVRFRDILAARVRTLRDAFDRAGASEGYDGRFHVIYPIKVNQRAAVVSSILAGGDRVGLEAGSKPELVAVLAMSRPGGIVVCNGYKDAEYIRMALMGRRLGLRVYLVVEKLAEVHAIIRLSRELGIRPALGVRLRLASIGYGKWQNTGGDKAKFGLSPGQLLTAVDFLREADMLDTLELLHFHMGSQLSNIRDIQLGVLEAGRYLQELVRLGLAPKVVDVGGGLAVDYEGAGSRGYFSMNYSADQYATAIVRSLREACDALGHPHPDLLSESGRALTAHHAVLVTEVTAAETMPADPVLPEAPGADAPPVIAGLAQLLAQLDGRAPTEVFEEARFLFGEAKEKFVHGLLDLPSRALADRYFYTICTGVRERLHASRRADQALRDELRRLLADKYFCNLSIFRSLPDIWAIDQVFPIMPLTGLDQRPAQRAMLEDLTCDSDGRIDAYVEADGVEATLPVHAFDPARRYLLGVFLVGAYQEILGDDHNLFGRTHTIDVTCRADGSGASDGGWTLHDASRGDSAAAVLAEVGFGRDELLSALAQRIRAADLDADQRTQFLGTVSHSLDAYTYLATDVVERGGGSPA